MSALPAFAVDLLDVQCGFGGGHGIPHPGESMHRAFNFANSFTKEGKQVYYEEVMRLVMALVMCLTLCVPAFATENVKDETTFA